MKDAGRSGKPGNVKGAMKPCKIATPRPGKLKHGKGKSVGKKY